MATGKPKRKKPPKIKLTDKEQSARFVASAKALGLERNGDAFERAMDSLAPKRPKAK
jgi:hypothetical protein